MNKDKFYKEIVNCYLYNEEARKYKDVKGAFLEDILFNSMIKYDLDIQTQVDMLKIVIEVLENYNENKTN